jgi:phage tail sheath gpL-like
VLLLGQKTSAGTAAANTLHRVTTADQLVALAGRGSMLHRMALAYFAGNRSTETYVGVLEDDATGVAATGTITVTGPATAAGTISLYVGGTLVRVPVASGDAAAAIATAIAAAVNAAADLPVTAAAAAAVVTLTCRNKGAVGNELDVRVNYQDGEATPAGTALAIVDMSKGATNPDLGDLLAALGDGWFQIWAVPYTDAASLAAVEGELASRFGPMRMIDGVAFAAKDDTHANLATLGESRNSPHVSIVGTNGSPTPPMEYAAHVAGVAAYFGNADPARPFQTLPLPWVKAPAEEDRWTLEERNLLLFDGISTTRVAAGGEVQLERLITTYKTNAAGADDTSYLDVTTMLTLLYLRYSFRNRILSRYPRHKLAGDGTRFGAGQAVITPKLGRAEAVAWFREMEELGLVENFDQFKRDLVVTRNAQDVNRLDFLLPPDLINQFIVGAAQIQFRL